MSKLVIALAAVAMVFGSGCSSEPSASECFKPFGAAAFPDGQVVVAEGNVLQNPSNSLWFVADQKSGQFYTLMYSGAPEVGKKYSDYFVAKMKLRVLPESLADKDGPVAEVVEVLAIEKVPRKK